MQLMQLMLVNKVYFAEVKVMLSLYILGILCNFVELMF